MSSVSVATAIAAHRFGLGEASLAAAVPADPQAWLLGQIGPADVAQGDGLLDTGAALANVATEQRARRLARAAPPETAASAPDLGGFYREVIVADARSRVLTATSTTRPFAERLQLFWANHFTVSQAKGSARGLVGAFERDAIRPHIAGSFEALLWASTTHPAMLRYLDNTQSAGPHSLAVAREARRAARMDEGPRVSGLNENLAREVLELHTLGADSARGPRPIYTQADVTAFARVLTGWRVPLRDERVDFARPFDPAWHEPGPKTLLGKTYPEGPDALRQVIHDLAHHPATARFIATKLARHFVADDPPPALVDRLAGAYQRSNGDLATVYRDLIASPEAWQPLPAKLKTPEEFVLSSARLLRLDSRLLARGDGAGIGFAQGITALGQRLQAAPSPAGWSDRAADWLGPDAVWKRLEWATRIANRLGGRVDARQLAAQSLGPLLGEATRLQIDRAADGPQALALLLMAPEFQRR
ncbi:MAG TPA: DUF1800 domain-containing protein [Burkholderiaceae bacterium]